MRQAKTEKLDQQQNQEDNFRDQQQKTQLYQQNSGHVTTHNNNKIVFGTTYRPVDIKCPFCLQQTKSEIILKPQYISMALGVLFFSVFPNAVMIVIVLFMLQFTATRKHRCQLCERQLGSDGKFLKYFQDEAYSFSIADSGILISKKIIVTILIIVFSFLTLYIRMNFNSAPTNLTDMTWLQFIKICPRDTISVQCKNKFQTKTINSWLGYVMKVDDQRENIRRFYQHAVRLYIKMSPSQSPQTIPDIVLTINSAYAYQMTAVLDQLAHGDQVKFNATFKASKTQADVSQNRHLHLVGLQKTGNHNNSVKLYLTDQDRKVLGGNKISNNVQQPEKNLRTDIQEPKEQQNKQQPLLQLNQQTQQTQKQVQEQVQQKP